MTYSHLTEEERNHIYEMKVEGLSVEASLRPSGGTNRRLVASSAETAGCAVTEPGRPIS